MKRFKRMLHNSIISLSYEYLCWMLNWMKAGEMKQQQEEQQQQSLIEPLLAPPIHLHLILYIVASLTEKSWNEIKNYSGKLQHDARIWGPLFTSKAEHSHDHGGKTNTIILRLNITIDIVQTKPPSEESTSNHPQVRVISSSYPHPQSHETMQR